MKMIRWLISSMVVVVFVVGVVPFARAEDSCECYCNVEGEGATKVPDESTRVTTDRCQELCRELGYSVATCAIEPNQKPQYNVMCFTSDECADQGGVRTATGKGNPIQPGECKQGMFYCYPNPENRKEATLQVAIGALTVTGDLGEYISSVYKWMLGVGTTIAIVFVMVAGLRWTVGGQSAEQIGKAQTTITNAVTGLVLLLSTYLIIFTVNPYLVRLQVPAFPMIKTVSLVGKESCGYLTGQWGDGTTGHYPYLVEHGAPYDSPYAEVPTGGAYELDNYKSEACGSVADVTKGPNGATVADDMTCTFDYCPTGKNCVVYSGGGQCLGCGQLTNGNAYTTPSTSSCSKLSLKTTYKGASYKQISQCFWTRDSTMLPGINEPFISSGTCAMLSIDCSQIKDCDDYDTNTRVSNDDVTTDLESIQFDGIQPVIIVDKNLGDLSLKSICNDDPCGVAAREGMEGKRCYSEGLPVERGTIASQLWDSLSGNDCDSVDL